MNAKNNDEYLGYSLVKRYNDDTFKRIIYKKYEIDDLVKLPIKERNKIINDIYNEMDVSIRQLSRVLGVGKTVVDRPIKTDK